MPEEWDGVTMEDGRVVELELQECDLTGRCGGGWAPDCAEELSLWGNS